MDDNDLTALRYFLMFMAVAWAVGIGMVNASSGLLFMAGILFPTTSFLSILRPPQATATAGQASSTTSTTTVAA